MSNINLQKDLELWVDFDERYWNPQTNRIQDQSGYGRHPEASGGPTIGAEGPNDFEAASFDGSDDLFDVGLAGYEIGVDSTFTVSALVKSRVEGETSPVLFSKFGRPFEVSVERSTFDGVFFRTQNESNKGNKIQGSQVDTGNFIFVTAIADYNEGYMSLYYDGELDGKITFDPSETLDLSNENVRIGIDTGNYGDMDVSFVTAHSRVLTDAEIEELNRMTAPQRSNL